MNCPLSFLLFVEILADPRSSFVDSSRDLEDLEACEQDAEHGHLRIEELVHAGESSELFLSLRLCPPVLRLTSRS